MSELWESTEGFRIAVEQATKAATQEVARRTRWRTTMASLLVGMAVACAISIPVTLVLGHAAARRNCEATTELADLGAKKLGKEQASTEDFKRKSKDRLGLSEAEFDKLITTQEAENRERQSIIEHIRHRNCG